MFPVPSTWIIASYIQWNCIYIWLHDPFICQTPFQNYDYNFTRGAEKNGSREEKEQRTQAHHNEAPNHGYNIPLSLSEMVYVSVFERPYFFYVAITSIFAVINDSPGSYLQATWWKLQGSKRL